MNIYINIYWILYEYLVDIYVDILWIFIRSRMADIWISKVRLIDVSYIFVDIHNGHYGYPVDI